jgi:O-antigen/teichoic acid export membrane protein
MTASSQPPADLHDRTRRSVLRNFRSVFLGKLFAAFSMWIALVVLAKLSDPATVGIYALAQAICIPVTEVAKAGLREIYTSDAAGTHRFGHFLGFRILASLVAFLVIVVSGLLQADTSLVLTVIILYALIRCAELISDIIHGLFQAQERMDYIGRSLSLLGPLSMLLLAVGYWVSGSLVVAVAGQLAAQVFVLALHDVPVGRARGRLSPADAFHVDIDGRTMWRLARLATPMAIATGLAVIAVYLPRMIVEREMDLAALGYFAAITTLAMAPNRLVNSLGVAVSVKLARYHQSGDRYGFLSMIGRLCLTVAVIGCGGLLLAAVYGDVILGVVYTPDYAAYRELFLWSIAAAVLRSLADVLKFGMIASRRFWSIAVQYGAVAFVAVVVSFTLIPNMGLNGAGIALVLIFATHLAAILIGLLRNLPTRPSPEAHP